MPDYHLFGHVLRSTLVLPELVPASYGRPQWVFSQAEVAVAVPVSSPLGREEVQPGVSVALHAVGESLRLVFDDTGVFDISADGRLIRWSGPAQANVEAVRRDLLGRVLALCLHQQGFVALHGSAVQLGGIAVAFLAPKYHGKSTTAAALVESGARLIADDLVAVTADSAPQVLPAIPAVHLWNDSAARVGRPSRGARRPPGAVVRAKVRVATRTADVPLPLAALYLLSPVRADTPHGIRRARLGGVEAALALLGQAKVGSLLGVERRCALLGRLGDLVERSPVYRLEIPRDLERLPELTRAIRAWHPAMRARDAIA